ncbi:hypothetical protein [uncultured Kriegella sp.]|uniref:hypothetical protein n=1 Tax=uncultured Kriegella sp. TaxID=1798910 RepID=UPI0030DB5AC4
MILFYTLFLVANIRYFFSHKPHYDQRAVTITTEFGPPNYLPTLRYIQVHVADQWKANVYMMKAIKNG